MALFIMCGLPGAGKTTTATQMAKTSSKKSVVLSADDIRAEVYGDASIQGDGSKVFALLNDRVKTALCKGLDVYYNCTSITHKGCNQVVLRFRPYVENISCIFVDTPLDVCKERNANRERVVPDWVIERMSHGLEPVAADEPFDTITIVKGQ